jgi:hypothetical protein
MVAITELQEFPAGELGVVVSDNGVWHPEPVDDVVEERHGLLGSMVGNRAFLNPLREFVGCNQQVSVAPGRLPQGPDDV